MGKGSDINYPAQQQATYGESMQEALQAQVSMAPKLYEAEADPSFGRPAYAELEAQIVEKTLLGEIVPPKGAQHINTEKRRWDQYVQSNEELTGVWDKQKSYATMTKDEFGKSHWY